MVEHPVTLRGLRMASSHLRPTILERKDQDFVPAILEELKKEDRAERIVRSIAVQREANGVLKLFQPVHRTFNVALVEGLCDTPGEPRLDPRKIESAGLVVRRAAVNSANQIIPGRWEGWMQAGKRIEGWRALEGALDRDPDPAFRAPELNAGHREINHALVRHFGPEEEVAENFVRMFPAPPEVCEASGKTVLFAIIPVTSAEFSEAPNFPSYSQEEVAERLPQFLRAGGVRIFPRAGSRLDALSADDAGLREFVGMLRQLVAECDLFGDLPEGQALSATLNEISVTAANGAQMRAGDFFRIATKVLIEKTYTAAEGAVQIPREWPAISAAQGATIAARVRVAMQARLRQVASGQGRFDGTDRQYHVRAFLRVKGHDHCPPRLIWSEPSEPFTIAPWYENNGAAPIQVTLPDATDRNLLKKLKPNVSFVMPKNLFQLLQNKSDTFMKGEAQIQGNDGLGIQWICSFSIPIITLCAFIVLNIFLQLFNLIFQWLIFVKICLPLPKPK